MIVHVEGTVDGDQVLSLRFGDSLKERLASADENALCDIFWPGDMQIKLIDTFGAKSNESTDFHMVGLLKEKQFYLLNCVIYHGVGNERLSASLNITETAELLGLPPERANV